MHVWLSFLIEPNQNNRTVFFRRQRPTKTRVRGKNGKKFKMWKSDEWVVSNLATQEKLEVGKKREAI